MGTSNHELIQMVKSIGLNQVQFLGVFDNTFKGFNFRNPCHQCCIINTDPPSKPGTHWIAMAFNHQNKNFYVFDPFATSKVQMNKLFNFNPIRQFKGTAVTTDDRCINIVTNDTNNGCVQCPFSGMCGLFCVFFLKSFNMFPASPFLNSFFNQLNGVDFSSVNEKPIDYVHSMVGQKLHANEKVVINWLRSLGNEVKEQNLLCHFLVPQ